MEIPLKEVTILHIQQIMNCNLEKGYSSSTLIKTRNLLKEFFSFYEDELPKNPTNKYKLFHKEVVIEKQESLQASKDAAKEKIAQRKQEISEYGTSKIHISNEEEKLAHMRLKTQKSQKDIHVFTNEEIEKIKDAIENGYRYDYTSRSGNKVTSGLYIPKQGAFFLFLLNTGIRAGEAVALKYSDFDFAAHTVQIHTTAVNTKERNSDGSATGKRNRTFTRPKTANSDTLLHLSPYAVQIILDMKAQEPTGYDGFVVHSDYKPLAEKALWQRFDKLLRGAKVCPCGLHSLRHTYGTKLYEETQDLKFVCQQLRHSDPSFTAKTYVHQTDKRTREILSNFTI